VIAAVCHGPAIFVGLKDKRTGELLIKGKKATGFSTRGEYATAAILALKQHNIKTIEEMIKEAGGIWQEPHDVNILPTTPFIVEDGRIITGVNPMSAGPMAQRAVEIIKGSNVPNKMAKQSIF
jgi:putative intracellular protease/amidase